MHTATDKDRSRIAKWLIDVSRSEETGFSRPMFHVIVAVSGEGVDRKYSTGLDKYRQRLIVTSP